MAVKPYLVAYYAGDGSTRQLAAFTSEETKTDFINYITNIMAGSAWYDWYLVGTTSAANDLTSQAKALGADVYNLPYE